MRRMFVLAGLMLVAGCTEQATRQCARVTTIQGDVVVSTSQDWEALTGIDCVAIAGNLIVVGTDLV